MARIWPRRREFLTSLVSSNLLLLSGCSFGDNRSRTGTSGSPAKSTPQTTPTQTSTPVYEVTRLSYEGEFLYAHLNETEGISTGVLLDPNGEEFQKTTLQRGEGSLAFNLFPEDDWYVPGVYEIAAMDSEGSVVMRKSVELTPKLKLTTASVFEELVVTVENIGSGPAHISDAAATRGDSDPANRFDSPSAAVAKTIGPSEDIRIKLGRPTSKSKLDCGEITVHYKLAVRLDHSPDSDGEYQATSIAAFDMTLDGYPKKLESGSYTCTKGDLVSGSISQFKEAGGE